LLTGSGTGGASRTSQGADPTEGRAGSSRQANPQGASGKQRGCAPSQHWSHGGAVLSEAPATLASAAGNADPYGPPARNIAAASSIASMRLARVMAVILPPRPEDIGNFADNSGD